MHFTVNFHRNLKPCPKKVNSRTNLISRDIFPRRLKAIFVFSQRTDSSVVEQHVLADPVLFCRPNLPEILIRGWILPQSFHLLRGRRIRPNICFNLTVHITSISTNRRQLAILRPTHRLPESAHFGTIGVIIGEIPSGWEPDQYPGPVPLPDQFLYNQQRWQRDGMASAMGIFFPFEFLDSF